MTEAIPQLDRYDEPTLDAAFATLAAEVRTAAAAALTPDAQEVFRLPWLGRKQGRLKLISVARLNPVACALCTPVRRSRPARL